MVLFGGVEVPEDFRCLEIDPHNIVGVTAYHSFYSLSFFLYHLEFG